MQLTKYLFLFLSFIFICTPLYGQTQLENEIHTLGQYFKGKLKSHPLDPFGLLRQDSFKHKKSLHITRKNIELRITNSYGEIQGRQFARDFTKASSEQLNLTELPQPHPTQSNKLELFFRDEIIARFHNPIKRATFFDNFLVFLEKDSYNPNNHTQSLSFIDLTYLEKQLGNNVALPIFKLPIKTKTPSHDLQIKNGQLALGNLLIEQQTLQALSPTLQMIYNMQANLVDPLVYEEIAESGHLDDLVTHFKRAINHQMAHTQGYLQQSLEVLKENTLKGLEKGKKFQKDFYSAANSQNKNKLSYDKKVFLKNLEKKQENLIKVSGALSQDMASKRKLMARLNIFIGRLNIPRPDGAPHIKKALAFVSTSLNKKKKEEFYQYLGGKKEAYRQLAHYGTKGALVGTAALAGLLTPEVYGEIFHQALQISQGAVSKIGDLFQIIGTGVNQTLVSLGKDFFITATEGAKETMVYEAFVKGDRLTKTFIAGLTLVSAAVIPAATSHILINSVSLLKDFKKSSAASPYKQLTSINKNILKEKLGKVLGTILIAAQTPLDNLQANINGMIDFLPKRQNKLNKEYLASIAPKDDRNQAPQEFTPEQDQQVQEVLAEIQKDKKNNSWLKKIKKMKFTISQNHLDYLTKKLISQIFPETPYEDFSPLKLQEDLVNKDKTVFNRGQKKLITEYWRISYELFLQQRNKIGAGDWVQETSPYIKELKTLERELNALKQTLETQEILKKEKWFSRLSSMKNKILGTVFAKKSKSLEITSFGKAFRHFLLSYASLTKTIKEYIKTWSIWFGFRSFLFKPKTLFTLMYYPNYFNRVTGGNLFLPVTDIVKRSKNVTAHYPSDINGAKRNLFKQAYLSLFNPKENKALNTWEEKIIKVEQEVYKFAFQEALNDISLFTQDIQTINQFLSHGGPQRIDDDAITKLHWKYKTFFRKHFKTTFDATMELYLKDLLKKDLINNANFNIKNLKEYKEKTLSMANQITVDKAYLKTLAKKAKKEARSYEQATELVKRLSSMKVSINAKKFTVTNYPKINFENFTYYLEAVKMNTNFDAFSKLNPRPNNQVKRMIISKMQSEDPQALSRAVRYTMTHFVNDKPMQLLMLFLLSAGIPQDELMQPVQNEFIGPNSIGYLSKFVGGMFAYDIMMSLLNTAWMKLQVDASHADSFGNVPSVEIAKKGAMHWFLDRTFKYKENSTWANQKIMNRIITDNLQAAFVNASASNFAVLNRFDLDSYITGYMLAYFPGYYGFSTQLDQGIDMSMSQILSEIPKELRGHPEVMNYYKNVSQKRRLLFNFLYHSLYENPLSTVLSNITNGQDRALARWTFGGYTPTELMAMGIDNLQDHFPKGSFPDKFLEGCNKLFTKNYTNWTKYKGK